MGGAIRPRGQLRSGWKSGASHSVLFPPVAWHEIFAISAYRLCSAPPAPEDCGKRRQVTIAAVIGAVILRLFGVGRSPGGSDHLLECHTTERRLWYDFAVGYRCLQPANRENVFLTRSRSTQSPVRCRINEVLAQPWLPTRSSRASACCRALYPARLRRSDQEQQFRPWRRPSISQ